VSRVIPALDPEREEFQPLEDADDAYMERMRRGPPRLVVEPSADEIERVVQNPPCQACAHFDLAAGRDQIIRERFWERLKREEKWDHFNEWVLNRDSYGVCHQYSTEDEGLRLVSGLAPGFARAYDFDTSIERGSKADTKVKCPYFKSQWGSRQKKTKH
jgi:hypothetical protein